MSQAKRTLDRVIAVALTVMMLISMLPISSVYAMAGNKSVLETNLGDIDFVVNEATEFTVTSTANDDAGNNVKGYFTFSDETAIAKLEYYETDPRYEGWHDLTGPFGPEAGFPIIDGTSKFRVTFNRAGEYNATIELKDVANESVVYCSTSANISVSRKASTITTDISSKDITAFEPVEFSFTSKANDDAGKYVKGYFEFSDDTAIEKLEYYETAPGIQGWYPLTGPFGPEAGFPIIDGTSKFRVTFNRAGEYNATIELKDVADESVVYCSTTANITVNRKASTITTDIASKKITVFESVEFSFTSKANDDTDIYVKGYFEFSDDTAIEKLEYYETAPGIQGWYPLTGPFGPEAGFPIIDGTSKFRVTFNKAGDYSLEVSLKQVSDGAVVCKTNANVTVGKAQITGIEFAPTENKYTGAQFPLATITGDIRNTDTVKYTITGDDNVYSSIPNALAVGKYEVTVTVDRGSNYTFTKTVTSEIKLGDIELGGIKVQGLEGKYTGNPQNAVSVTGKGEYSLMYKLDDGEEWTSTIPTVTNAGSYTVEVKATKEDTADSAVYPFNVYIAKADQTGFTFENTTPDDLAFGSEETYTAGGGQSGGKITYEVESGADLVTVDPSTGTIKAIKVGGEAREATIKATISGKSSDGKENYNDATAKYTIKTVKAEQTDFAFRENEYTVYYGTTGLTVATEGGQSNGNVTYTINESVDIASVSSADNIGNITFNSGKQGNFTVTATLAGNDNYLPVTAETEVKVVIKDFSEHLTVPTPPESGWFRADVVLTPATGYVISTSNSFEADWASSYTVSDEGENKDITVYLKEIETGYISEAISVGTVNLDKSAPTCEIKIKESAWNTFFNIITFGLYGKDARVYINPADETAGVAKTVYYKYNGDEGLTKGALEELYQNDLNSEEAEKSFKAFDKDFDVGADEQFVIYVRVEDKAGNYEYFSSDGYIVDNTGSNIVLKAPSLKDGQSAYGKDDSVSVIIEVSDAAPYSGIKSIKYQITEGEDETVTKEETLFSFVYTRDNGTDGKNTNGGELKVTDWDSETQTNTITETYTGNVPTKGQLVNEWIGTVNIDKEANNSSNVKFNVTVEDYAGNISKNSINLDIDITPPTIDVSFEDFGYNQTLDGRGYFGGENAKRVATVKFTERANHFDKVAAEKWITDNIAAVDVNGNPVPGTYTVDWIDTVEGETPDEAVHTATVTFNGDANYTWTSKDKAFSDKAGNANTAVTVGSFTTPWTFTVDKTAPASMKIIIDSENVVAADQTTLVYNRFYQTDINAILEANYDVSGMESMQYQIVRPTDEYKEDGAWIDYDTEVGITAYPTDKFVIYFRAEDRAGNVSIVRSTGIVVDDKAPIGETNAPEIDIIPDEANENGFHNGNVDVKIKVVDPKYKGQTGDAAGYYSGLNTVKYKITATDTNAVEEGVLLSPSAVTGIATVDSDGLTSAWAGSITIDSTRFNSNKVIVEVYAVDNAGNERTSKTSDGDIQIDITAPTIEVSYDNNDADSETYFKADRTATIVVTERNFDPTKVDLHQTNTDGAVPALSGWVKTEGTGNADDTKWTATVVYNTDGDYEFEIACTDLAGWTCNEDSVNYGVSVAPRAFTVDKTIPVVTTSYDNNVYENPYYFKETRTLTIVVTEHNFDASRFITTTTGQGMTEWIHDGDTHTARIAFTSDNSYTFNCTYKDMAGNEAEAREDETFVIDLTPPTVRLEDSVKGTAPEEKAAYNGEVNFAVYYGDTNIDMNKVVVTLTDSVGNDVESTLLTAAEATGDGFVRRIIDTVEQRQIPDGIYTLNVTVYDLAGNSTSIEPKVISVNRDSSSYIIGERLQQLIDKVYNNNVDGDIIISEINCCEITSAIITISCNGTPKTLTEGTDYTVRSSHDSREWYQNDYIISPSVFGGDGGYSLLIESKDGAGNSISNLSAVENVNVEFSVDKTAPVIIIKGLDEERYDESAHPFSIMYEDNLRLDRIEVKVTIRGREEVTVYSVDELGFDVVAGEVEHVLKEASDRQQITVMAYDKAGNESEVITDSAVVSTSAWVRYITNPVALVLTGVGVVVVAAAVIIPIIIVKKKKKEETEAANAR